MAEKKWQGDSSKVWVQIVDSFAIKGPKINFYPLIHSDFTYLDASDALVAKSTNNFQCVLKGWKLVPLPYDGLNKWRKLGSIGKPEAMVVR